CIHFFFFSSRRRHTRSDRDWSSDVCSSDLGRAAMPKSAKPSLSPSLRDHPPWNHGPMTSVLFAPGLLRSMSLYVLSAPNRSSARSEERRVGKEGRWRSAPPHV